MTLIFFAFICYSISHKRTTCPTCGVHSESSLFFICSNTDEMSEAKNHLSMGTSITLTRRFSQQNASSPFPRMWSQLSVFWKVMPVQVSNRNSHISFPSDCLMSCGDLSDHLSLKMLRQHKIQSLFLKRVPFTS